MKNLDIVQCYLNGERPYAKIGWLPKEERKTVGDTWEDSDGYVWEQKNGYKVKESRMAKLVRDAKGGIPKCSVSGIEINMNDKRDRMAYLKTGKCFDVLIEEEHRMRVSGIYKFYEQKKILENAKAYALEIREELEDALKFLKDKIQIVHETGMIDDWVIDNKESLKKELKENIDNLDNELVLIDDEIKNLEQKINDKK